MSSTPPLSTGDDATVEGPTNCYLHPDTPTGLRCSRCERPICGRCAIPASVGQHCPNCVAEARKSAPKVRSALRATAPVVFTLLVVNGLIWLAQNLAPPQPTLPQYDVITFNFASLGPAIADGQWWRLITPMFLHAPNGIWHIGFNSYALFLFGPHVEQAFGRGRFLVLYLIAGFTGNALSYAISPCSGFGVGASGAIFGVLGGLFVFLYNRRRQQFVREFMKNIIFLIGINLVFGFIFPGIDNLAHLGGLIGGAAVGLGFDRIPERTGSPLTPALTAFAVIGGAVLLVAWRTANFAC